MSEMDLGGSIKLTVPQLRVFLANQRRWISIVENSDNWNSTYSRAKIEGAEVTLTQLLKCLNLPEDWEEKMDAKEMHEASIHAPREDSS